MLSIIVCDDSNKRLKIHQYLDGKENKVSLYCELFNSETTNIFCVKAPCNKNKWIHLRKEDATWNDYGGQHEGGYYSYHVKCSCGGSAYDADRDSWESKEVYRNNIIVYGTYLKGYSSNKNVEKSDSIKREEYETIISELKVIHIPNPKSKLNKKELQRYIKEKIQKVNFYL